MSIAAPASSPSYTELPILLPATDDGLRIRVSVPTWDTKMGFLAPASAWPSRGCCWHLGSELVDPGHDTSIGKKQMLLELS